MKVYLLDDDTDHNFLNILLLNSIGIKDVESGTSMQAALKYLDNCQLTGNFPDIMFVDLNMPGFSGFTFIKQFEEKYWKSHKQGKIIMLTNSVLESEKQKALKHASVLDFWSKPLTRIKLRDLFQRIEVS